MTKNSTRKIAIIGGGFAGICFAAHLAKLAHTQQLEILIFEKSGVFGAGDAYRTPFSFHLLNVRAKDMSLFVDEPNHFVAWLKNNAHDYLNLCLNHIEEQFVPRFLYRHYLNSILKKLSAQNAASQLKLMPYEVTAIWPTQPWTIASQAQNFYVDEVILATGNEAPDKLPFAIHDTNVIHNPWHYQKVAKIPTESSVLIVGTGLSMIDAVLTLHHQNHQGQIYAVSRRGLLPLPHSDSTLSGLTLDRPPQTLSYLLKWSRAWGQRYLQAGIDWQIMINNLREEVNDIWHAFNLHDKKTFLRHVLPYWNIHRHRVPQPVAALLDSLQSKKQLHILSGRMDSIKHQIAYIRNRKADIQTLNVQWVVNCIGPQSTFQSALYQHLFEQKLAERDAIDLGLAVTQSGSLISPLSTPIYALGSLRKGTLFASSSVPEIRQQCHALAHLMASTESC